LKRIVCGTGAVIVGAGFLYWAYVHVANRRLEAAVAAVHGRGQRVLDEDFRSPPIPDDQNAVETLRQAAAATSPVAHIASDLMARINMNTSIREQDIQQLVSGMNTARKLVRQARGQRLAEWQYGGPWPAHQADYDNRGQTRLIKAMLALVHAECSQGHHAEAVELMRDVLRIADVNDLAPPSSHMMANSIRDDVSDVCKRVFTDLTVRTARDAHDQDSVSREQIDALIDDFLDEGAATYGSVYAQEQANHWRYLASQVAPRNLLTGSTERRWFVLLSPCYQLDAARMIDLNSRIIQKRVASRPYTEIEPLLEQRSLRSSTAAGSLAHRFREIMNWDFGTDTVAEYHTIHRRRVTALQLALFNHRTDHRGANPDGLEALIPKYLKVLPNNPFYGDESKGYELISGPPHVRISWPDRKNVNRSLDAGSYQYGSDTSAPVWSDARFSGPTISHDPSQQPQ
jgi:hypothetical protein